MRASHGASADGNAVRLLSQCPQLAQLGSLPSRASGLLTVVKRFGFCEPFHARISQDRLRSTRSKRTRNARGGQP